MNLIDKANTCAEAFRRREKRDPSKHAVLSLMSVGLHETNLGELDGGYDLPGNWGGITKRVATTEEKALAAAKQKPPPKDDVEQLHGDFNPQAGSYVVWFWKFLKPDGSSDDARAADKLIEVLLDERPSIKRDIDTISIRELATRMYRTGYYTGFHKDDPATPEDERLRNIDDYEKALVRARARLDRELGGWEPPRSLPAPPAPPPVAVRRGQAKPPKVNPWPALPGEKAPAHAIRVGHGIADLGERNWPLYEPGTAKGMWSCAITWRVIAWLLGVSDVDAPRTPLSNFGAYVPASAIVHSVVYPAQERGAWMESDGTNLPEPGDSGVWIALPGGGGDHIQAVVIAVREVARKPDGTILYEWDTIEGGQVGPHVQRFTRKIRRAPDGRLWTDGDADGAPDAGDKVVRGWAKTALLGAIEVAELPPAPPPSAPAADPTPDPQVPIVVDVQVEPVDPVPDPSKRDTDPAPPPVEAPSSKRAPIALAVVALVLGGLGTAIGAAVQRCSPSAVVAPADASIDAPPQ